jgi:hypothetical protein
VIQKKKTVSEAGAQNANILKGSWKQTYTAG